LNNTFIKRVIEENVKISDNKYENRVKIIFSSSEKTSQPEKTITLSGEGSLKILMPV